MVAMLVVALSGTALAARLSGTAGDDLIRGTSGDDVLQGLAGDDALYGIIGGNNFLYGQLGHDGFYGGSGDDVILDGPITTQRAGRPSGPPPCPRLPGGPGLRGRFRSRGAGFGPVRAGRRGWSAQVVIQRERVSAVGAEGDLGLAAQAQ